ncbi:MAG TPA: hypothetical protein VHD83_27435 [Puia sp.]|nr:hypothetical protein [Puia sp.]
MQKLMSVFMLALVLFLSFGCKKDSGQNGASSKYYFRFKADGTQYDIKDTLGDVASLQGGRQFYDGVYSTPFYPCSIGGRTTTIVDGYPSLWVSIKSLDLIKTGVYQSNPTDDFRGVPSIEMQCTLPVTDLYVKSRTYNSYRENNYLEDIKVNITELTIDNIKGTFSGSVYDASNNGSNPTKLSITDGEFFIRRAD